MAALLWVLDNVPDWSGMRVIYAEVTGNTHPICTLYAHKVVETLDLEDRFYHARREDRDFFSDLVRIGPPLLKPYRWCLTEFKRKAWRPHAHGLFAVAGIRAEESPYRAKWPFLKKNCDGQLVLSPIFTWSREEVLDFIREHGLRPNPCYDLYGHSGNCMFCPYHRRDYIIRTLSDPEWRPKILSALKTCRIGGPIQAQIKDRWLRLAGQTTLPRVIA